MRILLFCFLLLGLTACTNSSPEDVMPSVPYTGKTINTHSNNTAQLYWQVGKQAVETDPTVIVNSSGLIGALVVTSIDAMDRQHNPGKYNFSFGKAQQAIFMTSLRDALVAEKVFKETQLVTAPSTLTAQQTRITIYFKSTRAEPASGAYQVTLDVELRVQTPNKPTFQRTYFVQSDPDTTKDTSYKGQQLDASKKLMKQLMQGISQALNEEKI